MRGRVLPPASMALTAKRPPTFTAGTSRGDAAANGTIHMFSNSTSMGLRRRFMRRGSASLAIQPGLRARPNEPEPCLIISVAWRIASGFLGTYPSLTLSLTRALISR